jgi:hypothetical protein
VYRVLVRVSGESQYLDNGLTFETRKDAKQYALELTSRWFAVIDWKIEEAQS